MSDLTAQFAERVRTATGSLSIRGSGSKDFYGNAPQGEPFEVAGHRGILAYEPTELVITARGGTPLAEIEAVLAEKGQCLACEPPRFSADSTICGATVGGTTVGGAVAAGLSGPRRASAGAVRDFVLGVKLLDGQGRELNFGGQVMKNVAGYDVSRLVAGSLGTLGVILEVSLKVLPKPVAEATLRFQMKQTEALGQLNRWAGQPLPIVASCWQNETLTVRLAGARAAVEAAEKKLGGEKIGSGETAFWSELRDHTLPFLAAREDVASLWRLSLPTTAPQLDLPGVTLIEWGGAQRWLRSDAPAETIRAAARQAGGSATLFRADDAAKVAAGGAFAPLAPALLELHRRLKATFDPRGVFNPGRLYPEF